MRANSPVHRIQSVRTLQFRTSYLDCTNVLMLICYTNRIDKCIVLHFVAYGSESALFVQVQGFVLHTVQKLIKLKPESN